MTVLDKKKQSHTDLISKRREPAGPGPLRPRAPGRARGRCSAPRAARRERVRLSGVTAFGARLRPVRRPDRPFFPRPFRVSAPGAQLRFRRPEALPGPETSGPRAPFYISAMFVESLSDVCCFLSLGPARARPLPSCVAGADTLVLGPAVRCRYRGPKRAVRARHFLWNEFYQLRCLFFSKSGAPRHGRRRRRARV